MESASPLVCDDAAAKASRTTSSMRAVTSSGRCGYSAGAMRAQTQTRGRLKPFEMSGGFAAPCRPRQHSAMDVAVPTARKRDRPPSRGCLNRMDAWRRDNGVCVRRAPSIESRQSFSRQSLYIMMRHARALSTEPRSVER